VTVDVQMRVKVKLHRTSTGYVHSKGEISCILDPHIGQRVWSAYSGNLAVYRPTFSDKSDKLRHENIYNSREGKFQLFYDFAVSDQGYDTNENFD